MHSVNCNNDDAIQNQEKSGASLQEGPTEEEGKSKFGFRGTASCFVKFRHKIGINWLYKDLTSFITLARYS